MLFLFIIIALLFGGWMFCWTYGKAWELRKCILFAAAVVLGMLLFLVLLKSLLSGVVAAGEAAFPGMKVKVVEKVKGLL